MTQPIYKEEQFNTEGISQERVLPKSTNMRNSTRHLTEARLKIVAREMLTGTRNQEIAKILKVSANYVTTLMRTVRANGMLKKLEDESDDVVLKMERENTEAAREAVDMMRRRMNELNEEVKLDNEGMADAFKIFELTTPLTGIEEKHKQKTEEIKKSNNGGGMNVGEMNIMQIIGKDAMEKAEEAKRMTEKSGDMVDRVDRVDV